MNAKNILEVRNLSVTLDGERIIRDISFDVAKGESIVVIGPNGAGKTVLFRALLGLVPMTGAVAWSKDIGIGYIPQRLHFDKTVPITVKEFFLLKSR